jgi:hypothetical protein
LGSIKNLDIDELEEMRKEHEKRLKELERVYMSKKENSSVGRIIRERMGYPASKNESQASDSPRNGLEQFERDVDDS